MNTKKDCCETIRVAFDLPRSVLIQYAALPEWISQRTVERETGVGPRTFLEDVASAAYDGEVIRRGKLRVVRRDDYMAWLRRRSDEQKRVRLEASSDGADAVLAEVGLRMVSGGNR